MHGHFATVITGTFATNREFMLRLFGIRADLLRTGKKCYEDREEMLRR